MVGAAAGSDCLIASSQRRMKSAASAFQIERLAAKLSAVFQIDRHDALRRGA